LLAQLIRSLHLRSHVPSICGKRSLHHAEPTPGAWRECKRGTVLALCIRLQTIATFANVTFLVTLLVTLLTFGATSMAHSGVALLVWACYLELIEPPLR